MPKYVLNPDTLLYEEKEDPKYLKHIHWAVALLVAAGCVFLYFWLYTSVFQWDLPKTAMLKRRAAEWEAKMEVLSNRLDLYDRTLTGIEQRDDQVYRSIYGLGEIPRGRQEFRPWRRQPLRGSGPAGDEFVPGLDRAPAGRTDQARLYPGQVPGRGGDAGPDGG